MFDPKLKKMISQNIYSWCVLISWWICFEFRLLFVLRVIIVFSFFHVLVFFFLNLFSFPLVLCLFVWRLEFQEALSRKSLPSSGAFSRAPILRAITAPSLRHKYPRHFRAPIRDSPTRRVSYFFISYLSYRVH